MCDYYFRPPPPPNKIDPKLPFVTGSYAYGKPTEDSDLDLVIFVDPELVDCFLLRKSDSADEIGNDYALRFNKLNLICCTTHEKYEAWRFGTEILIQERPVSRKRAIEVLRTLRIIFGVEPGIEGILYPRITHERKL